jgi:hypothetical protein
MSSDFCGPLSWREKIKEVYETSLLGNSAHARLKHRKLYIYIYICTVVIIFNT